MRGFHGDETGGGREPHNRERRAGDYWEAGPPWYIRVAPKAGRFEQRTGE